MSAPPSPLQLSGPARLRVGWRTTAGSAEITDKHVRFLPTGWLGGQEISCPLHRVQELGREGQDGIRLVLPLEKQPGTLTLQAPASRLAEIARAVLPQAAEALLLGGNVRKSAIARLETSPVGPSWDREARISLICPAVRWAGASGWPGLLLLSERQVIFLPEGASSPLCLAVDELARGEKGGFQRVHLRKGEEDIVLELAGGEPMVELFWQHCATPDRVLSWPDEKEERERILDGIRMLQVRWGEIDVEHRPGMALPLPDGIGLVLPREAAEAKPGTIVEVGLGHGDGCYRFSAVALRTEPLPARIQVPRNGRMLVLAAPDALRFTNQRRSLRAGLQVQANAWNLQHDPQRDTWIPAGDRIEGSLIDLSTTGCSLQTDTTIPVGARLFLEVLVAGMWLPLEAECVRSGPGWPVSSRRLGLHFLNVPPRLEQLLSQAVTRHQLPETGSG